MAKRTILIVGGGPAGLAAAERLSGAGHLVTLCEAMPTVGRKLLMAGKSGLNLTHSDPFDIFLARYGEAAPRLAGLLETYPAERLRAWADALGADTFVGTSGRVFPRVMKASPLLRAWLARLEAQGVTILTRYRLTGFSQNAAHFDTAGGETSLPFDALLLALGGASWPRLGSDGQWAQMLRHKGVAISPLQPANCGFDAALDAGFLERFAGTPVKSVTVTSAAGSLQGEFVITRHGVEGSLIYAHSAVLREAIRQTATAALEVDLAPGRAVEKLERDLARVDRKASFSNRLRKGAGLDGVKAALLRALTSEDDRRDAARLARRIKALAVPLLRPRPIEEAISTAGGIAWGEFDTNLMLKAMPGTFAAGEMLDWEAPTGGYLLTACFASGWAAADGIDRWLSGV
ncbi:TIGR03862 family flavoprotein [Rhizobium halophytocola]|uniref:Flavoprotein (TIGR03862 family) n=1 Tax=Rhizobium halophytocola TaxID=735519 RepID=A0ABS4E291_9HYPH|nr:TIGR03862 family flavoprotein [Rhizobium halophytocola]MBP1852019.1 putative flavoprotein (TIGR03862 family) [Rhizobium halophytocola]